MQRVRRVKNITEPFKGDADGHPATARESGLQESVWDDLQDVHLALLQLVEQEEQCAEQGDHQVDAGEDEEEPVEAVVDLGKHDEGEHVAQAANDTDRGDVTRAEAVDREDCRVIAEILTDLLLREVHH